MSKRFIVQYSEPIISVCIGNDLGSLASEPMSHDVDEILQHVNATSAPRVIVDFQRREYFGSALLEALLRIWHAVRDRSGKMAICGVSKVGHDLLSVSHFERIIPICETREEAERILTSDAA